MESSLSAQLGLADGQHRESPVLREAYWFLVDLRTNEVLFIGKGDIDDTDFVTVGKGLKVGQHLLLVSRESGGDLISHISTHTYIPMLAQAAQFVISGVGSSNRYMHTGYQAGQFSPAFSHLWFRGFGVENINRLFIDGNMAIQPCTDDE